LEAALALPCYLRLVALAALAVTETGLALLQAETVETADLAVRL
jgi:hypothetical protein